MPAMQTITSGDFNRQAPTQEAKAPLRLRHGPCFHLPTISTSEPTWTHLVRARLRRPCCSSSVCRRRAPVMHQHRCCSTGVALAVVVGVARGRSGPMVARVARCARALWSIATHRAAGSSASRSTRGVLFGGHPVASPCLPLGVGISPGQFGSTRSMLCTLYWRR